MIILLFLFGYWWLILPIVLFIVIPFYIYNKTIEFSSRYTITTFLIAWPLRLLQSCIICTGLLLFSFIPVAVVIVIMHILVVLLFKLSHSNSNFLLGLEFLIYFMYIVNITVVETLRNFAKEIRVKS